jgi:hypothetical protein
MAPRPDKVLKGAKSLAKFFARQETKAVRKVRYDVLKKMGPIDRGPVSPWAANYSKTATAARKAASSKRPGGIKPDGVKKTPTGRPVGRIAKTPVRRENLYAPIKGKAIAQTDAEKRTAEWAANKMLRRDGFYDNLAGKKPAPSGQRTVGARGSFTGVGSKRQKGIPTSKKSVDYEADPLNRQAAQDRRAIGRGQKKNPAKKAAKVPRPAPAKNAPKRKSAPKKAAPKKSTLPKGRAVRLTEAQQEALLRRQAQKRTTNLVDEWMKKQKQVKGPKRPFDTGYDGWAK